MRSFLFFSLILLVNTGNAESLYREETFRPLTADHRAYRIGDALTVLVVENSTAASSADTTTNKKGSVGITVHNPGRGDKTAGIDLNDEFNGAGKIQRTGKLLATLTVNVVGHTENGDLLIAGTQLIEVNDEKQHIKLDGRVRPVDIGEGNTIISSRIADAKISYIGDGILGEKQKPGVLTRILSWLGIL
jgi:flagellar L-ring protein precursor FlgH